MNRLIIQMGVILSLGFWSMVQGAVPDDFRFKAHMTGEKNAAVPVRLTLPKAVIANTDVDFNDIRVFDDRGIETPYIIYEESRLAPPPRSFTWKVIDYEIKQGIQSVVLERPKGAGTASDLNLITKARDFSKGMKIHASRDRLSWRLIAAGAVFDWSSQIDLRKTGLKISDPGDPFLKVVLEDKSASVPMGENIGLRYKDLEFTLHGGRTYALSIDRFFSHLDQEISVKGHFEEATFRDPKAFLDPDGNTIVELGRLYLPVHDITFQIRKDYFYRQIQFQVAHEACDKAYLPAASGVIFKMPHLNESKESMTVEQPKAPYARLKIVNNDNPPLEVQSIKIRWIRRNLFFIPESRRDYGLFFGGEKLSPPHYELNKIVSNKYDSLLSYAEWKIDEIQENEQYKPVSGIRSKVKLETMLFIVLIIFLVIGLGIWAFKLMKKLPNTRVYISGNDRKRDNP